MVRALGRSAIGTIYLARDTRLDRDVALEVGTGPASRDRLAREVRVLARLSHPNIVAVYEVGELAGGSFLAREHVPGTDAHVWATTGERSAAEIVALYTGVGDGLAAAHREGIVHGEVGAAAILVGEDRRPRLAHFGSEHAVDARADQRAYCLALAGALRTARRVPRRVTAALRRGSAPDPEARWPSMTALVAELRRGRSRRTARIALGAAALATVGAAVAIALALARHDAHRATRVDHTQEGAHR